MCKKARAIECTVQMQSQFWIVHSIALAFVRSGSRNYFCDRRHFKCIIHRLYVLFFKLLFLSSKSLQPMGSFLEISIAGRKCLCVSRKLFLWPKHFDTRTLVPMFYMKLCNYMYIYIYIYQLLRNLLACFEKMFSRKLIICFENIVVGSYDPDHMGIWAYDIRAHGIFPYGIVGKYGMA